ncbi:MAG: sugar ABC transporter substrate-binding protein [Firmicutes bacterium]|nr:sugar ABC transporter substrate-binding protein [Bacillota bacterium]
MRRLLIAATIIGLVLGLGMVSSATDLRAYEGTTLNLLLKEGYEIDVIKSFKDDFEKDTGIKVNIEIYDEPTTRQKYIFDVTSRTGMYDITSVSFWYLPEYYRNGWLAPLNDLLKKDEHPWDFHYEDIPASAIETFSVKGELYAMPHTIIGGAFYYRKDIFEKYGLTPPSTTDDIIALAKKIDSLGIDIYPFIGRGVANFSSLGSYAGWAWTYGATLLDKDFHAQVNSPTMVKAISDYVSLLRDYGPPGVASMNFNDIGQMFAEGKVAMMYDTTGWGGMFNNPDASKVAGKVGIRNIAGPTGEYLQWIYMEGLGINKYSRNKEAAMLFLKWRMSRETTKREAFELKRWDIPNLYVMGLADYKKLAAKYHAGDYVEFLPKAWASANIAYWPWIPEFVQLGDAFMKEVSAAVAGDKSPKEALDNAQVSIERILKKAGYYK